MSWDTCTTAAVDGVKGEAAASISLPSHQFANHHQRLCNGPQTTSMQALITPASSPNSQSEPSPSRISSGHTYVRTDEPPQNRQGPPYLPNLSPHQVCRQCKDTPPHVAVATCHENAVQSQHLAATDNDHQSYPMNSLRHVTEPGFSKAKCESQNEVFNPPVSYLNENSATRSRQESFIHDLASSDNHAAIKMHQLADSNFQLQKQLQEVKILVERQNVELQALQQENVGLKSRMQEQQQWQQWKPRPRQHELPSGNTSCSYPCYYSARDCPLNGTSRHRHQSPTTVIQDPLAALLYADKVLNAEAHRSATNQLLTPNTPISMFSNYPSSAVTPSEQTRSISAMSGYSGQRNNGWEQKGDVLQRHFYDKGRESDETISASDVDYSSHDEEGELIHDRTLRPPPLSRVRLARESEAGASRKIPEIGSFFPPRWPKRKATYDEIDFDDKRMKGLEA